MSFEHAAFVLLLLEEVVFVDSAFPVAESFDVMDSSKEEALSLASTLLPTALPAMLPKEALAPRSSEDSLRRRCCCCCPDSSNEDDEEVEGAVAGPEVEGGGFDNVSEAISEILRIRIVRQQCACSCSRGSDM